jgi:hypothetical protein
MSDWEPTRLPPSNNSWETNDILQILLQENPARIHPDDLLALQESLNPDPVATSLVAQQEEMGGLENAPTTIGLNGQTFSNYTPAGGSLLGSSKALDLQQGLIDFVRYFLPGAEFDPDSGSQTFQLGEFLLGLFARLLTFPGGAMLAHSILTSIHCQVPEVGDSLNLHSNLSIFETLDSRAGKLIRKLLGGIEPVPIATPHSLQRIENWIHTTAGNYRALEDSGVFEEPDFLSRLFREASDQMGESHFPGQKAGWTGVVFYALGFIYEHVEPEIAEHLFESGDLFFNLSEIFNLSRELRSLNNISSFDDLFRVIDNAPLGPLGIGLTSIDGVMGLFDYVDSTVALWDDPSLNPYIAGDEVWPRRISVMFTGIEGILSAGLAVITLASGGAVLAVMPILMLAIGICGLLAIILDNWDWFIAGLSAWKDNWSMLTQVIIPYRTYQAWQWFDDNLGRPVRENFLQPIGNWAHQTWNGLTNWAHSLAGD